MNPNYYLSDISSFNSYWTTNFETCLQFDIPIVPQSICMCDFDNNHEQTYINNLISHIINSTINNYKTRINYSNITINYLSKEKKFNHELIKPNKFFISCGYEFNYVDSIDIIESYYLTLKERYKLYKHGNSCVLLKKMMNILIIDSIDLIDLKGYLDSDKDFLSDLIINHHKYNLWIISTLSDINSKYYDLFKYKIYSSKSSQEKINLFYQLDFIMVFADWDKFYKNYKKSSSGHFVTMNLKFCPNNHNGYDNSNSSKSNDDIQIIKPKFFYWTNDITELENKSIISSSRTKLFENIIDSNSNSNSDSNCDSNSNCDSDSRSKFANKQNNYREIPITNDKFNELDSTNSTTLSDSSNSTTLSDSSNKFNKNIISYSTDYMMDYLKCSEKVKNYNSSKSDYVTNYSESNSNSNIFSKPFLNFDTNTGSSNLTTQLKNIGISEYRFDNFNKLLEKNSQINILISGRKKCGKSHIINNILDAIRFNLDNVIIFSQDKTFFYKIKSNFTKVSWFNNNDAFINFIDLSNTYKNKNHMNDSTKKNFIITDFSICWVEKNIELIQKTNNFSWIVCSDLTLSFEKDNIFGVYVNFIDGRDSRKNYIYRKIYSTCMEQDNFDTLFDKLKDNGFVVKDPNGVGCMVIKSKKTMSNNTKSKSTEKITNDENIKLIDSAKDKINPDYVIEKNSAKPIKLNKNTESIKYKPKNIKLSLGSGINIKIKYS
jgi:hypothetical protein